MKYPFRIALFTLLAVVALRADVSLAPLFTDHGVLQRDQPVPVWGTADDGEAVTVQFGGQSVSTVAAADGRWMVKLAAMPASAESRSLTVTGNNTLTLNDVLVGDVWLTGGQSNMEWPLRMTNDAEAAIAAATYPEIRHIKIQRRIARDPLTTAEGEWVVCSPETAAHFTAVGYYFARRLHTDLNVPVGLVNSSWGGTSVEAWLSPAAFEDANIWADAYSHQAAAFRGMADNIATYRDRLTDPNRTEAPTKPWTPGAENHALVLNNGMIAPLVPYALRGVIWYQGEANADQPSTYRSLFGALINDWREQFEQPELPFYWVQLANWGGRDPDGNNWAFLREAQTQTLELPHTGQAIIIDIGDAKDIHPRNKLDVGDRLARLALRRLNGRDIIDSGPEFTAAFFEDADVRVVFAHAAGLRTTDGTPPKGFELAGRDFIFHPATGTIDGNAVVLTSEAVPMPLHVRYAWRNHLEVNLANGEGLPAIPFRTDNE